MIGDYRKLLGALSKPLFEKEKHFTSETEQKKYQLEFQLKQTQITSAIRTHSRRLNELEDVDAKETSKKNSHIHPVQSVTSIVPRSRR